MTAGGSNVLPLTRIFWTSNFIGAGELLTGGGMMMAAADKSPSATSTNTMPLVKDCSGSDTRT